VNARILKADIFCAIVHVVAMARIGATSCDGGEIETLRLLTRVVGAIDPIITVDVHAAAAGHGREDAAAVQSTFILGA
jgi:hypothetical protein